MEYKTILKESNYEFEEKRSIFIGYASHVESEIEAREFIDKVKSKHSDARHNVYGYILGKDRLIQRYTDDGEPQGTAGIPIIEVIKKSMLTDIVIVVTRYFGGTLLGVGGLTRAYVRGATGAISNSLVVDRVVGNQITIEVGYDLIGKLQYFFNENQIDVKDTIYDAKVIFIIRCEKNHVKRFITDVTDITSSDLYVEIGSDVMYFKNEGKYLLYNEF